VRGLFRLASSAVSPFLKRPSELKRVYSSVAASGLFDEAFYLEQYPDVRAAGVDPLAHYLESGWREGRDPNPLFNTSWYLETYADVAESGVNPLYHYLRIGTSLGRNPSPFFDTAWYLKTYPDVEQAGINPLGHYLTRGIHESRSARSVDEADESASPVSSPFDRWIAMNELSDRDIDELRRRVEARSGKLPKISILTPVYNSDESLLHELADSILSQIYDGWEWCLVDDGSPAAHIGPMLEALAKRDPRIRVSRLDEKGGISAATNTAAAMATGEVLAFVDHDDLITRDCLAEIALCYAENKKVDLVYSDDDKIDVDGRRFAPQFKPDWSPVLLLSWAYLSHIITVRKSVFDKLGGFRSEFDGSQDYDFTLRASEAVRDVGHIPKVLYHWRAVEGSTASGGDAKPASIERGRRAVEEALKRRGLHEASAIHPEWADAAKVGMFEIRFPDDGPSVCLIIPTKNQASLLRACLESIEKTTYRNFEILVVDNETNDAEALSYLARIADSAKTRVVRIASPPTGFNFANLNNLAARHTDAEYLLFLNNDTQVIAPHWLSQMIGYAQMKGVGAVGARLYFEDGTVQHAGIVHGYHEGLVGHAFRGLPPHDWGYLGFVRSAREYSGVTAACMLTPRKLFEELRGFDEDKFAVAYNDVDYCYRIVLSGRRCIYCPTAELWHYEGKSRGFNDNPAERVNFRELYGQWHDRWYNPNLSLENERFEPAAVRPETSRKGAVRTLFVSHNLGREGAPMTLFDLIVGLRDSGVVDPVVISPAEGPLRDDYQRAGIRVIVLPKLFYGVKDADTQEVAIAAIGMLFAVLGAEVVVANTLQTYWAILSAASAEIPTIWCQHESEPWQTYFDYLPADLRPSAHAAFEYPYRVTYVAEATRRAWRALETRGNFKIIRHGIPEDRLKEETGRWTKNQARLELGVPDGAQVICVVGTVCRRKGQIDLARAYAALSPERQESLYMFVVGNVAERDYEAAVREVVAGIETANFVVTDAVKDAFLYYVASDIFVCTSRVESAPRVIVEAMACGLPIITTPVFGIPEIVDENVNALFYEPRDVQALAALIEQLLSNDELRERLGRNSGDVLRGRPGFTEMVREYAKAVRQAVNLRTRGYP